MNESDHNYLEVLAEQARFLRKSCAEFDAGDVAEAKRLALGMRNLLHGNQKSSPAVLSELELDWLPVVDTRARFHARDIAPYFGLTTFYRDGNKVVIRWDGDEYAIYARRVPLGEWKFQPVFDDRSGIVFSRMDLIRSVADQDGGAHVQRKLGPKYGELFRKIIPTMFGVEPSEAVGPENVQLFAVRQIAHELLRSIDPNYAPGPNPLRPGTIAIRGISTFLLPGRKMTMGVDMRPGFPWDSALPPLSGEQQFIGPMMKLPYEDTKSGSLCCCGSGLIFDSCCKTPHEFPDEFMQRFIDLYQLPVHNG